MKIYTLQEIRQGTGFAPGARFVDADVLNRIRAAIILIEAELPRAARQALQSALDAKV